MPDYTNAEKTELSVPYEQEQYVLRSRPDIIHVLRELSRKPDIITGYFNEGSSYLLTAVLGVLPDRDLVVLDHGPDDTVNQWATAADRIICVTKHDNVTIRFAISDLKRAKFQQQPVFAAPLPDGVFRLQRREFFRVPAPMLNPIVCRVSEENHDWDLEAVDISIGGIGLIDRSLQFQVDPPRTIEGCVLKLPEQDLAIDVEIRYWSKFRLRDGREVRRIGCAFRGVTPDKNVVLQRFINKLQVEQRATSPDD